MPHPNNNGSVPVNFTPGIPFDIDYFKSLPNPGGAGIYRVKGVMLPYQPLFSGWTGYQRPIGFPLANTPLSLPEHVLITKGPLTDILTSWHGHYGSTPGWKDVQLDFAYQYFVTGASPRDGGQIPTGTLIGPLVHSAPSITRRAWTYVIPESFTRDSGGLIPYNPPGPYIYNLGVHEYWSYSLVAQKEPVADDPETKPVITMQFGINDNTIGINFELIRDTIENLRRGITYINFDQSIYIRQYNATNKETTRDLDAPTILTKEVMPSNFLHIHMGAPIRNYSTWDTYVHPITQAELRGLYTDNGIAQIIKAAPVFPTFGVKIFGLNDAPPPTQTGSVPTLPQAYQYRLIANREGPMFYRDLSREHVAKLNDILGVRAEYMGENPTEQKIINCIADFYGFEAPQI